MSATNRGSIRLDKDAYQTPAYAIDWLLPWVEYDEDCRFLEPCRGDGAIYHRVHVKHKDWCEIREGRDYLSTQFTDRFDLIITNPPFSLAMPFLTKSLDEADTVIYLMRVNMLGSGKRKAFWNTNPPTHLFILSKRPSFTGNGTDATEYAWFVWDRADCIRSKRVLTVL